MSKEKSTPKNSETRIKKTSYILLGVWILLVIYAAVFFGLIGQNAIDAFAGTIPWTTTDLVLFISAAIAGVLGLAIYIAWVIVLFKKPAQSSITEELLKDNKEEDEKDLPLENIVTAPTANLVPTALANTMPNPNMPHQPGFAPSANTPMGMPPRPMMPNQPGMAPRPGMPPQPGMPPRPMMPNQPGMAPRPGMPPQPGMPPRPMMPNQPGMAPRPGMPPQPGMMPPRPGMPPRTN